LYFSPNLIKEIKSREMKCAAQAPSVRKWEEYKNSCRKNLKREPLSGDLGRDGKILQNGPKKLDVRV
jgi:hypothetical protein